MSSNDDSADADLRIICGPTGAGKSAVAMWLASRFGGAIISADSRQVYRRFDIGTSKPSREDRARIPHEGIDVIDPTERHSAAAWSSAAEISIARFCAAGLAPIVVGGTGLYLRALLGGLFAEPSLDPGQRRALAGVLTGMDTTALRRWAEVLDPARAHLGRTQLLRAIELALLAGVRISRLHEEAAPRRRWRPCYLVVDPGGELATRNVLRTDAMIAAGWVDEVRELMVDVPEDAPAWQSTGYRAIRRYVTNEIALPAMREALTIETRQYVKRQRTWFRHQLPADRTVRVSTAGDDWRQAVETWWTTEGGTG